MPRRHSRAVGSPKGGKGRKKPRNHHRGTTKGWEAAHVYDDLPDLGTGADPTQAAPQPLRHDGRRYRGGAAT